MPQRQPTFFDACAGIGCFHLGMKSAFRCIGAAEWDNNLRGRYPNAFELDESRMFGSVHGLVNQSEWVSVKEHMDGSTMTAGFPCTPFSKSGKQTGKGHIEGSVFWSLLEMMDDLNSPAFIFENVTNLLGQNHTEVWEEMRTALTSQGYSVDWEKITTKDVGVPQNRNRVFIVGLQEENPTEGVVFRKEFSEIKNLNPPPTPLNQLLSNSRPGKTLTESHKQALIHWETYLGWLRQSGSREGGLIHTLSKPLWAMEAFHDYNIESLQRAISRNKGKPLNEQQLRNCLPDIPAKISVEDIVERYLPPYYRHVVMGEGKNYLSRPIFASNSRNHMRHVKLWVENNLEEDTWAGWLENLKGLRPSFQKFEWHLKNELPMRTRAKEPLERVRTSFGKHFVQFRSSGIRVSRADKFPTLVAIGQVPYIGSPRKMRQPHWKTLARLQSIPAKHISENEQLFGSDAEAIRRLGNAVNVRIVEEIAYRLNKRLT